MVIAIAIGALQNPAEPPSVDQADKRVVVCVLEVSRNDLFNESVGVVDLPSTSVGHPGDDVCKIWIGKHRVELCGKLLNSDC